MSVFKLDKNGLEALVRSEQTWQGLEAHARKVAARVDAPSHLRVWVKRGIAKRGANVGRPFAQVIMEGPGALAEEFGTRSRPPKAPLRRALRGGS